MDTHKARWILDFLLQKPLEDRVVNHLFSVLPLPAKSHNLMKKLLLRLIWGDIREGVVSNKMLEYLELIGEMDYRRGGRVLDSLKEAYCAVAVDCTVKVLRENPDDLYGYKEAVLEIWRGRVGDMEKCGEGVGLVSDRLKKAGEEIEAALWNVEVRNAVLMRDTRTDALELVRVFLVEAAKEMGPPFLELVAEEEEKAEEKEKAMQIPVSAAMGNRVREGCASAADVHRDLGGDDGNALEDGGGRKDLYNLDVGTNEAIKNDKPVSSPRDLSGDDGNMLVDGGERMNLDNLEEDPNKAIKNNKSVSSPRDLGDNDGNVSEDGGQRMDLDKLEEDAGEAIKNEKPISTPEVMKVRDALKLSRLALQAVVKDPLPDALRMAVSMENVGHVGSAENQTGVDMNRSEVHAQRPSLMERNETARTYEWDDESVEGDGNSSSGRSPKRPHLPSPKNRVISPLRNQETRNVTGRRRKRKWSSLEEQTLVDAVREHGRGNWKRILDSYHEIFEERTAGDLKDKWRNMTK